MVSPFDRERMENWASDFLESSLAAPFRGAGATSEYAAQVLVTLLGFACTTSGRTPGELESADLRAGLLEGVSSLELPESVARDVPDLVAAFLEQLEREGRLADGRAIGLELRAMRQAYLRAAGGGPEPIRRVASKLSPNGPCPCGSGRKYKKCCQG